MQVCYVHEILGQNQLFSFEIIIGGMKVNEGRHKRTVVMLCIRIKRVSMFVQVKLIPPIIVYFYEYYTLIARNW